MRFEGTRPKKIPDPLGTGRTAPAESPAIGVPAAPGMVDSDSLLQDGWDRHSGRGPQEAGRGGKNDELRGSRRI